MDGVVEIITGRERRRRWSVEQKFQVGQRTARHKENQCLADLAIPIRVRLLGVTAHGVL